MKKIKLVNLIPRIHRLKDDNVPHFDLSPGTIAEVYLIFGGLVWNLLRRVTGMLIGATATTIGNNIYFYTPSPDMAEKIRDYLPLIVHELIHIKQFKKNGLVRFVSIYFGQFFREFYKIWRSGHGFDIKGAYAMIGLEREAYDAENYMYQHPEIAESFRIFGAWGKGGLNQCGIEF